MSFLLLFISFHYIDIFYISGYYPSEGADNFNIIIDISGVPEFHINGYDVSNSFSHFSITPMVKFCLLQLFFTTVNP